eukprot:5594499-Prymnesium_polylepis.1
MRGLIGSRRVPPARRYSDATRFCGASGTSLRTERLQSFLPCFPVSIDAARETRSRIRTRLRL